jgi:hypothetical protein
MRIVISPAVATVLAGFGLLGSVPGLWAQASRPAADFAAYRERLMERPSAAGRDAAGRVAYCLERLAKLETGPARGYALALAKAYGAAGAEPPAALAGLAAVDAGGPVDAARRLETAQLTADLHEAIVLATGRPDAVRPPDRQRLATALLAAAAAYAPTAAGRTAAVLALVRMEFEVTEATDPATLPDGGTVLAAVDALLTELKAVPADDAAALDNAAAVWLLTGGDGVDFWLRLQGERTPGMTEAAFTRQLERVDGLVAAYDARVGGFGPVAAAWEKVGRGYVRPRIPQYAAYYAEVAEARERLAAFVAAVNAGDTAAAAALAGPGWGKALAAARPPAEVFGAGVRRVTLTRAYPTGRNGSDLALLLFLTVEDAAGAVRQKAMVAGMKRVDGKLIVAG